MPVVDLDVLRHSTAHIMAKAVQRLYPGARLALGPPIEDGFYYDIDVDQPIGEDDLERIESEMRTIISAHERFERLEMSRQEAIQHYESAEPNLYKVEILQEIPDDTVSFYKTGQDWLDLCRGPHIPDSGAVPAFKLLSVAGAYWRGDEHRPMLQRIYGTAWPTQEELDHHLWQLEEAKRRDHRRLGRELGLFLISDEIGPGLPLWLPKGAVIRRELERYIIDEELRRGYQHVSTPHLAKTDLYRTSGHWDHYKDSMYPPMQLEHEELVLRPMNCPHHIMIYRSGLHSYRELPIRLAELGTMYRYERSGELTGLSRVRAMTLNDAHIFCRPDQIQQEFISVVELIQEAYRTLGFEDYWYRLSLRDPEDREKFVQDDAMWELAETALNTAMSELGVDFVSAPGEAAFYGPKLDVQVKTALGKEETISTVQLDFYLPERFELEYIAEDGRAHRPVMIHRGVISTLERIVAFLIEIHGGAFPLWLSPVQAVIVPIADRHLEYAESVAGQLRAQDLRVEVDSRRESMRRKIRDAELQKMPYMLVVGDRDVEAGAASVRERAAGDLGPKPIAEIVSLLVERRASRT